MLTSGATGSDLHLFVLHNHFSFITILPNGLSTSSQSLVCQNAERSSCIASILEESDISSLCSSVQHILTRELRKYTFSVDEGEPTRSTTLEATIATKTGETVRGGRLQYSLNNWLHRIHSLSWMVEHMGVGETEIYTSPEILMLSRVSKKARS
ncbi:hypothetical protein Tco_1524472 [Tanacetum coccineum]